jgi:hypothetical protein
MPFRRGLAILIFLTSGCREQGQPAPAPSPAAPAGAEAQPTASGAPPEAAALTGSHPPSGAEAVAGRAVADQAPPPPSPAPVSAILRAAEATEPGGSAVKLAVGEEAVVDPAASYRVELAAPCEDARLALLDAADAVVASSGTREVSARTLLTLAPSAPLISGKRYLLRLDGAITRELHDAAGNAHLPAAFPLLVAGEPPPPEPKPAPKKRRRR